MNLAYALCLTAYGYENFGALAAETNIRYAGICSAVSSLRHAVAQNMYVYFRPMDPLGGSDRGYGVEIDEFTMSSSSPETSRPNVGERRSWLH